MPDPKGLAEAIASDLEAVGFTVELQDRRLADGLPGRRGRREVPGVAPRLDLRLAGTRQLPEHRVLPLRRRPAEPGVRVWSAGAERGVRRRRSRAATTPTPQAAWEKAQDILARDIPTVPLVHSKPPAAASADVKGFLGAGNLNEPFYAVWLDK